MINENYWREHYANKTQDKPSPFAKWASPRITGNIVYDIGCGDGRDTVHLAKQHVVRAVDPFAPEGHHYYKGTWRHMLRKWPVTGADTLYARWFFHAITETEEDELLRRWRGELFLEGRVEVVNDDSHWRRPHDPDLLADKLLLYGYVVEYLKVKRGWAKRGDDNPKLVRVHAVK